MGSFLRRVKGAIGNALTWGVTWLVGSLVLSPLIMWATPWSAVRFVVLMTWFGALGGLGFSACLAVVGRKTLLGDLRAGRIAVGAGSLIGLATVAIGVGLSAISGNPLPWVGASALGLWLGTMTAASALVTVRLAQGVIDAGESRDRIEAGEPERRPGVANNALTP